MGDKAPKDKAKKKKTDDKKKRRKPRPRQRRPPPRSELFRMVYGRAGRGPKSLAPLPRRSS